MVLICMIAVVAQILPLSCDKFCHCPVTKDRGVAAAMFQMSLKCSALQLGGACGVWMLACACVRVLVYIVLAHVREWVLEVT